MSFFSHNKFCFKRGCKMSTWQAHIHYYLVSLSQIKSFQLLFLLVWYNYDNKVFCHCKSFSTNRNFTTQNTKCLTKRTSVYYQVVHSWHMVDWQYFNCLHIQKSIYHLFYFMYLANWSSTSCCNNNSFVVCKNCV